MADVTNMLNLNRSLDTQSGGAQNAIVESGGLIGGAIGAYFGNPVAGATIGKGVGTVIASAIPTYESVRASVQGVNFVGMKKKPYFLQIHRIHPSELKNLDKIYKYYGVESKQTKTLNLSEFMYQGHAFVQGDLEATSRGSQCPLHRFQQINQIFRKGVHILEN